MDTEQKIALTELQARILEVLLKGHQNAIRREDLQKRIGIDERKMREVIESLRREGHLILVNASKPFGYFLAETQEEVDQYVAYMRSRIIDEYHVYRSVRNAAKKKFAREYGQIPMFMK